MHGLRDLIGWAEAGRAGYDAVVLSARKSTPKAPTHMSVREIFEWIKKTPRQNHAIGKYQIIPSTLRRLVAALDVDIDARFSPELQDRMANLLLVEAGLPDFIRNEISRTEFMNNLAKVWAGLPNASGKSHYHGIAGNKAVISWLRFEQAMNVYFPP